jgi:hypothetical protein
VCVALETSRLAVQSKNALSLPVKKGTHLANAHRPTPSSRQKNRGGSSRAIYHRRKNRREKVILRKEELRKRIELKREHS